MTVTEKATELVAKFTHYIKNDQPFGFCHTCANSGYGIRHCAHPEECGNAKTYTRGQFAALICVEEMIASSQKYTGMYDQGFFDAEVVYWQQVRNHIQSQ